jgi:type I restriction enzyme, S subunit
MSKVVPDGWEVKRLGDISTPKRGITYTASQLGEPNQNLPLYLNMKSFLKDGGYNWKGDKYFNSKYRKSDLLSENNLLLANTDVTPTGDILGVPLLLPNEKRRKDVLYSHHVTALNIDSSVSIEFIYYLFCSSSIRREMHKNGRGTTVKMLDVPSLLNYKIPVPPLLEQQKIASILTSVDEVIEKTQSQINKLQDLKKGTMNELLTRGIGHTEFKDSPVGRIPKGWEVVPLLSFCSKERHSFDNGPFGSDLLSSELTDSGVPVIYIRDITDGKYKRNSTVFVTTPKANSLPACHVHMGDVIIQKVGDPPCMSAVYDCEERGIVTQDVIRIRVNSEVSSVFLSNLINSFLGKGQVRKIEVSGTRKRVSLTEFKKIILPLPSIQEQQKIASILSSIDTNIEEKQRKLQQTQSLKKSLMQDLLTGKVRVTVH